jgi:hypothetical protein
MADTYTDRLGLIAQEEGQHANEWGDLLNLNFQRLDSATRGYIKIALSGAESLDANDITTVGSTAQEESFFKFIEFTGTAGTVTVPAENIMWIVYNNTGSNFTFQPSGGTGVTLTNGKVHFIVYGSNGTTFTDVSGLLANMNAETVTVADESADTTCNVLFVTAATGDLAAKSGTNLTFNSSTGALTASTFNPDGDTNIGDSAAVGYTATEGLILTGQGSSNDVTLKNDADATVLTIPTGTTDVDIVGDVTAATVQADGDTSAGDNAAMGYTAEEGLILTGQGSTNDITVKNDADADVLTVPTGTTRVQLPGTLEVEAYNEDADQYTATTGTRDLDVSVATYFYPSADMGTASITFTFSNPASSGRVSSFILEMLGADGATITWPASVKWPNGDVEPIWTSGTDIVGFITRDGGTTWLGFAGGLNF